MSLNENESIQQWIELGPIHEGLPGAMKLKLGMRGDQIIEAQTQFGYLKRSIQENMIGQSYKTAQLRFSRVEPESALLLDRLYSEAVETLTSTVIPERVNWIRDITSQLNELSGFLKYLANIAERLGVNILFHIILKHREELLDLIELLTGSRHGYYYVVPGGVRYNLTEGFQERLESWIHQFRKDQSRISALFSWTHPFQNRLQSLGRIIDTGEYGFISEASVENSRYGMVSSVESRLQYALNQCEKICLCLESLLTERPSGAHLTAVEATVGLEICKLELETGRGEWSLNLKLDAELKVSELELTTPSDRILPSIGFALEGESFEDMPLILASLDFRITEIDR